MSEPGYAPAWWVGAGNTSPLDEAGVDAMPKEPHLEHVDGNLAFHLEFGL